MFERNDVNGRRVWGNYEAQRIPGSSRVPITEFQNHFISTAGLLGLDLGSGSGRSTRILKDSLGCNVVAVDLSRDGLRNSQSADHKILADVASLPFKDNTFDFTNLSGLMTNLTHQDPNIAKQIRFRTAREVYRTLKPGGIAVVSDFASTWELSGCVTNYSGHALITGEYGTTVGFNPPCPTDFEAMTNEEILKYAAKNTIDRFTHHYSPSELIGIFRQVGFTIPSYSVELGRSPSGRLRDALVVIAIKS